MELHITMNTAHSEDNHSIDLCDWGIDPPKCWTCNSLLTPEEIHLVEAELGEPIKQAFWNY